MWNEQELVVLEVLADGATYSECITVLAGLRPLNLTDAQAKHIVDYTLARMRMDERYTPNKQVFRAILENAREAKRNREAQLQELQKARDVVWMQALVERHVMWQAYMSLNPFTGEVSYVDNVH